MIKGISECGINQLINLATHVSVESEEVEKGEMTLSDILNFASCQYYILHLSDTFFPNQMLKRLFIQWLHCNEQKSWAADLLPCYLIRQ